MFLESAAQKKENFFSKNKGKSFHQYQERIHLNIHTQNATASTLERWCSFFQAGQKNLCKRGQPTVKGRRIIRERKKPDIDRLNPA